MRKLTEVFLMGCLITTICSANVLLNDTWADASRTQTNLPTESAVWAGTPASVAMGVSSLAYTQGTSSQKLWTYFAANGSPVSLAVGEKLIATIQFTPKGNLYASTARNFRFGLFNDPTNNQVLSDTNSDGGGTGNPWTDSTGYAAQFSLSSGAASTLQIGKRTDQASTSLLGSTGAYTWGTGTGAASNLTVGTLYTITMVLDYQTASLMKVDLTFANGSGWSSAASLSDTGLGGDPIWTKFDQLYFRFSSASGTADVLDFSNFKIEHVVPEPATMLLLGLGALVSLRRRG